jgi:uncharacterized cupredoxin-like copper-binding protein
MSLTSRAMLLAAVAGSLWGLTSCAGGEPDPVRDRDATLRLVVDEYRIRPQSLKVRPGRVHLVVRNKGRLTHNVKVESEPAGEAEPSVIYGGTATAHPGETVSADVPLAPGKYRLSCTISGHDNLGQYGTLVVEPYK